MWRDRYGREGWRVEGERKRGLLYGTNGDILLRAAGLLLRSKEGRLRLRAAGLVLRAGGVSLRAAGMRWGAPCLVLRAVGVR
jgi:hypothetical protein